MLINKSMYKYNAELRRVVDGDTVDVTIDCGFNMTLRSVLD